MASGDADRGRVPLDRLIDREISQHMLARPWTKLEPCFKWQLVRDYVQKQGVRLDAASVAALQALLRRDAVLGIRYDGATRSLLAMDLPASLVMTSPAPGHLGSPSAGTETLA